MRITIQWHPANSSGKKNDKLPSPISIDTSKIIELFASVKQEEIVLNISENIGKYSISLQGDR